MWIFSHHFRRFCSKKPGHASKKGFTLIEMLVVMSIMMVITGALLIKQSSFNSSTILRSLAYGVALSVRQAQVYGTSVVGTSTTKAVCGSSSYNVTSGNCYASGYGLYFSSALSNASPSSYVLFADLNGDGQYQNNEYVKSFNFSDGYNVSDICATEAATANIDCWVGGTTAGLLGPSASLSIMFKRPNPDACFSTNLQTTACAVGGSPFYKSAYVEIQTKSDTTNIKRVTVTVPGEVMVGISGVSSGGSGGGLACSPSSQHAALDTYATYTASGGTPGYNWVIPDQGNGFSIVPTNGSGPTLQIKYTTAGTYSVPLYDSLVVTPQTCTLIIP